MRVLIDTSFARRGPSGTAVYLERLVAALRERGEVEVVEPPPRRRLRPGRAGARWSPLRSAANAMGDLVWLHVSLPGAARRARADLIHHPLPAHAPLARCAQVVTVHDAAFLRLPERFDPAWRALARRAHRRAARRAAAVVCVSETAARDAAELLGAPRERIVVAPHGPGQLGNGAPLSPGAPDPDAVPERPGVRHFLYVGDDEPRKDLAALLRAYAEYRAGAGGWGEPLELVLAGASAARARGGAPGVRGEPGFGPARLRELLAGAAALVHPSLHEGFGLTLLEAMAAGVPAVAVRNPGAEEVLADAGLLVEPGGLAAALARVAADGALRERLSRAGRARARAFSWERSAAAHERAYNLACEAKRRR